MATQTTGKGVSPCYKCEDRHGGCHAECDKYTAWRDAYTEYQKNVSATRASDRFNPLARLKSPARLNRIYEKAMKKK
jgi:ABC-type transporter lipoprotein component MlaA